MTTMFSVDPEDDGGEEYNYFDHYVYFVYFPDVDYVGYFLHAAKIPALPQRSLLFGVELEDPLHTCALKPYIYALFSITCQLFYKCHIIMLHCICGFG